MKNEINNYIYKLPINKKMEKYHFIFKNTIELIQEKEIDDILIVFHNVSDVDCLAIIDELLLLNKNISTLFIYKSKFKWIVDIRKIHQITDLDSFFNIKYTLNKDSEIIDPFNIKNILLCIDNYNSESKSTNIKYKEIFKILSNINFSNKIGICYDFVSQQNIRTTKNKFNLDFLITEKKVLS